MESTRRSISFSVRTVACAFSFLSLASCSDAAPDTPQSTSIALGANAATASSLQGPGGVRLDVPAGASSTDMTIVLATEPGSRRGASNGAVVATPLTLSPEGAEFTKFLELTVPIQPSSLPAGKTLADVVVMTAPHGSDVYVPLPTRRSGDAVVATTTHFSDFVAIVPTTPIDPPDEVCPIPNTTWSFGGASTVIRSVLIRSPTVYAIADSSGTVLPLYEIDLATGTSSGSAVQVERPGSAASTSFPRLDVATLDGEPQLFVSYLRTQYDPGTGIVEYPGGFVRVGPFSTALPATASLVANVQSSADGVYADATGPRVLSWPLLSAPVGTLSTLSLPAGTESLDTGFMLTAPTTPSERAQPVYAGERLLGLVRADEDDPMMMAQHWTAWPVSTTAVGAPVVVPGTITTFTVHDSQPELYSVDSTGSVRAYSLDDTLALVMRNVATVPAGYSISGSSAKMVYTNGSIVFPVWKGTAPALLRVRIASGTIEEWVEPDAAVLGWSALTARDGAVCYGTSSNTVRCGCLAGSFVAVP